MFPPHYRIVLTLALGAFAVDLLRHGRVLPAVLTAASAIVLGTGLFLYGSVSLAARCLGRGDLVAAKRFVAQTWWPRRLTPETRATYHQIKGTLALAEGDLDEALRELRAASEGRLRTTNDRALVHLLVARVLLMQERRDDARDELARARALPHKPAIAEAIAAAEAALGEPRK